MPRRRFHKSGIYLLPNFLTSIALFAGFYAIIAAINGQYQHGAIAILIAIIFDTLDGRIARLTNTASEFGMQYDSLSDMLSFGLAPVLLIYHWAFASLAEHFYLHKLAWLAVFLYTAGAALRLARFNTQIGISGKNYFQGLPTPAAAGLTSSFVWMMSNYQIIPGAEITIIIWLLILLSAILMVSNMRYFNFKSIHLKMRSSFKIMLLSLTVVVIILIKPPEILFIAFLCYTLLGVTLTLWQLRKKINKRHKKLFIKKG